MSRSKKHTPIVGNCSTYSMGKFRTNENRSERRKVRRLLKQGVEVMPHKREYQNEWSSPRDGKHYFPRPKSQIRYSSILRKYMLNWLDCWLKLMRKK